MSRYVCTVCGYVYDEAKGIPKEGIAPGTLWDELPGDWVCPLCGASKAEFEIEGGNGDTKEEASIPTILETPSDIKELSSLEASVLCTNLARGCEKQYKMGEAALFMELAEYFKGATAPHEDSNLDNLLSLVEENLSKDLPIAHKISSDAEDRGALRALVWSEKVTRILKSILTRYKKEGEQMLQNTGIYVCTICGFIYIGDELPKVCPVCKVPNQKFEMIEGR